MSLKELKAGAILVADSHYAPWRTEFIDFLRVLENGELYTTQLILMGDNCDLLFGPISETVQLNQEIVTLLNRVSKHIEIIYLEGNHDFRLVSLFPNITVIARNQQPLMMNYGSQIIALLHGDVGGSVGYEVYTALIRNRPILYALNCINSFLGGAIIKWLSGDMQRKNHCKKIENFELIAHRHHQSNWIDECDIVIEGHYHQNKSFDYDSYRYINLGAFACNERIYVVKSLQDRFILDETMFHKEPK
jgi:UDP-2,3-diacylglucosamine hydrolase